MDQISCAARTGALHLSCTAIATSGGAYVSVHRGHSIVPATRACAVFNEARHATVQLRSTT